MTGPDDSRTDRDPDPEQDRDPDRTGAGGAPAVEAAPAGRSRRAALRPVPQRMAAVLSVVAVLVVVGLISAAVPAPNPAPAPATSDGVPVTPAASYSSSAFCVAGTGAAASATVYLTNPTRRPVSGVMTTVSAASSATVRRSVRVPALGSAAVAPAPGGGASSLAFAGGGVVVDQGVAGPGGWDLSPCASRTSGQWSFAGGSTASGNLLSLALFNPAATEAVANVSFLTPDGLVTPQNYQGLEIPAGQLVVENVGDFVQNVATIATLVTAQAGSLVSSEFQQWSPGGTGGVSLRLGSPALATTWRFAQTTTLPGSSVDVTIGNPGTAPVTASLSAGLSSGTVVPHQVVVPPLSVAVFAASSDTGLPLQTAFSLTVTSSGPTVVGRSVGAPGGSAAPVWGSSPGTVTVGDRWLVPGPGVPGAPAVSGAAVNSLAVANPGTAPVRVVVSPVGGSGPVAMFTVPAGRLSVVLSKALTGLVALVVSASQPVYVEEDAAPTGAPGVVSSTGFPLTAG